MKAKDEIIIEAVRIRPLKIFLLPVKADKYLVPFWPDSAGKMEGELLILLCPSAPLSKADT